MRLNAGIYIITFNIPFPSLHSSPLSFLPSLPKPFFLLALWSELKPIRGAGPLGQVPPHESWRMTLGTRTTLAAIDISHNRLIVWAHSPRP